MVSSLISMQIGAGTMTPQSAGATASIVTGASLTFALQSVTGARFWRLKVSQSDLPSIAGQVITYQDAKVAVISTSAAWVAPSVGANLSLLSVADDGTGNVSPVTLFLAVAASSGGASSTPTRISSATTLTNAQSIVYANTSAAAFSITMPASPVDGQQHTFYDDHAAWGAKNLTLLANSGQQILDVSKATSVFAASSVLTVIGGRITFEYDLTLSRWGSA